MRLKRRWGMVSEIKSVKAIYNRSGSLTPEFKDLPNRLKHLSAWRGMHRLRSHDAVHSFGIRQGSKPSSNLPLRKKLAFIKKRSIM